jgi:glycosyltransferase involved in cell wall biosynthesis
MDNPLFSIIVPVHNGQSYLPNLIEGLSQQTYQNYELIIVNDGSTDDTEKYVNEILHKHNIKYISQYHNGVASARNNGFSISSGNFIIFFDCDDKPKPYFLESYFNKITESPNLLLLFSKYYNNEKLKGLREAEYFGGMPISVVAGSYCISRDLFFKSGGFDEDMKHSENWELILRIILREKITQGSIGLIHEPIFIYYSKYSLQKLIKYKHNKIYSYQKLYFKHKNSGIYNSKMLSQFAQIVANNYAGIGNFSQLLKWTFFSIMTYPFQLKNYCKPILIFIKRRFIPYS